MKTAIYIEDGVVQLVVTPECDFEKNALSVFAGKPLDVKLFHGSFYDCRGGWVRQKEVYQSRNDNNDASIILTVRPEPKPEE